MRQKIEHGLGNFQDWCIVNRLKLNVRKSKSLVIGSYHKMNNIDLNDKFILKDQYLDFTETYNYLGVILDKNMSLVPLLTKLKSCVTN